MSALMLMLVLAQPPKQELPKSPPREPSVLGPSNSAFPDLKLSTRPNPANKDEQLQLAKERNDLIFKPALIEIPKDATLLQKVQYEQVREGIAYLQRTKETFDVGRWDASSFQTYLDVAAQVHRTAAELHPTSEGKIRCYEARVILLKDLESFIDTRVNFGAQPPQDLHLARYRRLESEADLLKLKDSLKGGK